MQEFKKIPTRCNHLELQNPTAIIMSILILQGGQVFCTTEWLPLHEQQLYLKKKKTSNQFVNVLLEIYDRTIKKWLATMVTIICN